MSDVGNAASKWGSHCVCDAAHATLRCLDSPLKREMRRSLGLRSLTTGAVCLEMRDCRREGATLGAEPLREAAIGGYVLK